MDKTKLDKYSSSFEAAYTKYKDNATSCLSLERSDCSRHNIPKEVLMAVASRESRAGSALGL